MAANKFDYVALGGVYNKRKTRWEWKNSNGYFHRSQDQPAQIYDDGTMIWFHLNVKHRDGGPCIVYANGDVAWLKNGVLHRIGGPALEFKETTLVWPVGHFIGTHWFVNGKEFPNGDDAEYKEFCFEYRRTHEGALTKRATTDT